MYPQDLDIVIVMKVMKHLLSNNLVEVTGEVTQGAMSGENSNSERRIHIRDVSFVYANQDTPVIEQEVTVGDDRQKVARSTGIYL